jgi:hypothetical protein
MANLIIGHGLQGVLAPALVSRTSREVEQPPPRDEQAYLPATLIMAGACLGCNWQ